jgi:transmembrane sensor
VAVVREAAAWLVRLHSGKASTEDFEAFERWRRTSAQHEQAWRRADRLSQKFGAVSPALGVPILTRSTGTNRRAVLRTLLVLGVAAPGAWLGYRSLYGFGPNEYRTAVGENRRVMLADGSRVQLNTATDMDVHYSDSARLVQLRQGEIYIQTASDTQGLERPFLVDIAQGRLRALGTRFSVRALAEDKGMAAVTVLEHRVEITLQSGGSRRIVDAGETLRFSADTFEPRRAASTFIQTSPADPPDWMNGTLQADAMRLDVFLQELSRYRSGVIRCDEQVAGLRVSGVFRLGDIDRVLDIVAKTLPVRIIKRTRYWVLVTARTS